jgi:site-specific DNA-methyltransferase (cytosine-N4-specific)
VKDAVNVVWWLSKTARPKADNRHVLTPYSPDMERLLDRQAYNGGRRPGGARVGAESWKRRHDGAIPPNVLELPFGPGDAQADWHNLLTIGGSESTSRYHRACNALAKQFPELNGGPAPRYKKHPARFPVQLPTFFVRLLTDVDDLVVDPFAGSNVTGQAAELAGRRWASFELHRQYLEPSVARFDAYFNGEFEWLDPDQSPLLDAIGPKQLSA